MEFNVNAPKIKISPRYVDLILMGVFCKRYIDHQTLMNGNNSP